MPDENERRTVGSVLNKVIERVNSTIRRLRILEQEMSIYKTRTTSLEEEILTQRTQINKAMKEVDEKISGLEERFAKSESVLREVIEQLKKTTTAAKIKELEELIDIYNPLKSQFTTREEVQKMINEKLRE